MDGRRGPDMRDGSAGDIYQVYLRYIVHAMKLSLDAKLAPYDITNQQARLLGAIHRAAQQKEEVHQKDLEESMRLRGPSITSLLQGLERKGFIGRLAGNQDARTKALFVTEKGLVLIAEMDQAFRDIGALLVRGMTPEERETYKRLLRLSYHNLTDDSGF